MAYLKTNRINGEKPQFGNLQHINFLKTQAKKFNQGAILPTAYNVRQYHDLYYVEAEYDCGCGFSNCYRTPYKNDQNDLNLHKTDCANCGIWYIVDNAVLKPV